MRRCVDTGEFVAHLRVVRGPGGEVALTPIEARLLDYLFDHAGEALSHERLLVDVWGYRSKVHTRTLYSTVNRLRAKIELDPKEPRHLIALTGEGYRFHVDAPAASPLPFPVDAHVGRDAELASVLRRLEEGRLVTLRGTAGIGKTRLGLLVARAWPGDAAFCDLQGASSLAEAIQGVAAALSLGLSGKGDDASRLGRVLAARGPALYVLDNFEQIVDHAAATVGRWLELAPDVRFLVTSRERLGISGEAVVDVEPLEGLEARRLFELRAAAVDGGRPRDPVLVDAIVARLEGIPLAIELAAAHVDAAPLDVLRDGLDDQLAILDGAGRRGPARHATMTGAIAWSWTRTRAPLQRVLAACSVFRAPFEVEDARDVAGADLASIKALRDASLLRSVDGRLALYEAVRQYAAQQLALSGRAPAVHAAHRAWILARADAVVRRLEGFDADPSDVPRLLAAVDDLRGAHARALVDAPEDAVRIAILLDAAFARRPAPELHRQILDQTVDVDASGAVLHLRGRLRRALGDYDGAAADFDALARFQPILARVERGALDIVRYRLDVAIAGLETALEAARVAGSAELVARAQEYLAVAALEKDEPSACLDRLGPVLAVYRRLGRALWASRATVTAFQALWKLDRVDEALERLDEARGWFERSAHARDLAWCGSDAAWVRLELGDLDRARVDAITARAAFAALGDVLSTALVDGTIALVDLHLGRIASARERLRGAREAYRAQGAARMAGMCTVHLAVIDVDLGRIDAAVDALREVTAAGDVASAPGWLALVLALAGRVAEAREVLASASGPIADVARAVADGATPDPSRASRSHDVRLALERCRRPR